MVTVSTKAVCVVSDDDEHGDDNDGGLDNEDGECSLSTSCMMERGASLIIPPRDHPVHVSHPY